MDKRTDFNDANAVDLGGAEDVGGQADDQRRKESVATQLVNLALAAGIELWHDPDKNPWATLKLEGHIEHHPLKTKAVKRYLQGLYFEKTESAAHSEALQSALGVLESRAVFKGKAHDVFVRVAETNNTIYLDLCDAQWRVVRITAEGWNVIQAKECPVRFRRSRGAKPLPAPTSDNNDNRDETRPGLPNIGGVTGLGALAKLINVHIDSREWRLFVAWLLSLLRGQIPYPVLVLNGEQGSGKSMAARLLRAIIDPNGTLPRSLPKERRDLFISATNSWVQCFDNISGLPEWLSDDLCRLATGGGLATRELYTDNEEILLDARRPCILNGITDFVTRQDLVDRSILITLPSIPDDERKAEADLLTDFEAIHPSVLGELLTIVSAGLRRLPHTKLDRLPRMADFTLWVTACEEALDWEHGSFAKDFTEVRREMVSAALESESVVEALRKLVVKDHEWQGTATELFESLVEISGLKEAKRFPDWWPKAPNALSNKLRRLAPALRHEGIDVKRLPKNTEGMRLWGVRTIGGNIAGTAGIAVTHKNARVRTAMNGDERRSYGDHGDGPEPAPDKAYGDDGDNGDLFPHSSDHVEPAENEPPSGRVYRL